MSAEKIVVVLANTIVAATAKFREVNNIQYRGSTTKKQLLFSFLCLLGHENWLSSTTPERGWQRISNWSTHGHSRVHILFFPRESGKAPACLLEDPGTTPTIYFMYPSFSFSWSFHTCA
jgi:hypothetical protein